MNRSFLIFTAFLRRDFFIYLKQIKNYLINYGLIYPILFSISYGYIIPNTNFETGKITSLAIILTGNIAFILLLLTITLNMLLLLDFDGDRYVDFQLTIFNAKLLILQKIIFSTLFSFFMSTLFFIMLKVMLRENFDTTNLSTYKLIFILLLSCFTCSSYATASVCILKGTHKVGSWWRRVNTPMLMLGGSWVPWITIFKTSNFLGYILLINPMIYITEGIRSSILGPDKYIPFVYCILILMFFSILFTLLALFFFKKRTDFVQ